MIVNGIMIALVVFTVLMRMYTRIFILRWLGLDDLFILIATVRICLRKISHYAYNLLGLYHWHDNLRYPCQRRQLRPPGPTAAACFPVIRQL